MQAHAARRGFAIKGRGLRPLGRNAPQPTCQPVHCIRSITSRRRLKPQCYAILDVSQSAYDVGKTLPPKFVRAVQHDAPFEFERNHYTSSDTLPEERV